MNNQETPIEITPLKKSKFKNKIKSLLIKLFFLFISPALIVAIICLFFIWPFIEDDCTFRDFLKRIHNEEAVEAYQFMALVCIVGYVILMAVWSI